MSKQKDQNNIARTEGSHRIDRRSLLKITGVAAATVGVLSMAENAALAQTSETWDKVFPKSDRVEHRKVSFPNRFGITLVGDLYVPKNLGASQRLAALVVAHPYGGVKEQTSGLYAQTLAERGFVTLAYDASFHGESGGQPRANTIADFWVEDFSGAVDYLGKQTFVDRERIGALGICGGGGYALAAAAIDQRIKAVATSVMYDIGQGNRQGLSETFDLAAFQQQLAGIAKQRWAEVDGSARLLVGATAKTLPADAHPVEKEFWEYYGTPRGHHPRATPGFDRISNASMARFWSFDQLPWISPRPVLLVAGEHAHSRFFSEQANDFATDPKELYIVPGAGHVDLYDRVDLIPWDKLSSFFQTNLA